MVCLQRRLQRRALTLARLMIRGRALHPLLSRGVDEGSEVSQLPSPEHKKDKTLRHSWSRRAIELVHANRKARGTDLTTLVTVLMRETGNPRHACWRFIHKQGIPAQRSYKRWSESQRQHLLHLIELHPPGEVARILGRSLSSVRSMLKRSGASAEMGKDWFTKYTLAEALHVNPGKVQQWIERGWLKARTMEAGKAKRLIIEADDFCRFCKEHGNEIVGHRLHRERLDFVQNFVFPPAHAQLLPVRTAYGPRPGKEGRDPKSAGNGKTSHED